jgi:hypothetical protein
VVLAVASPAVAQEGEGLPGGPVLSKAATVEVAKVEEATRAEQDGASADDAHADRGRLEIAARSVADYLTRAFIEDAEVVADGSLNWSSPASSEMKPNHDRSVRIKIKTAKLEAEFEDEFHRTNGEERSRRRELLTYKDLIGRSIVEVHFDRVQEELADGSSTRSVDDAHALGYAFDPVTVRFEMKLREDQAANLYENRLRAILESKPLGSTGEGAGAVTVHVGVERAFRAKGFEDGGSRLVAGLGTDRLWGSVDSRYMRVTTKVEIAGGAWDEALPGQEDAATLGITSQLGLESGGETWKAKASVFNRTDYNGVDFGALNAETMKSETGLKLEGEWRFNEKAKLFGSAEYSLLHNEALGLDPTDIHRKRGELGVEFNDRWRVGVMGSQDSYDGLDRDDTWTWGVFFGFKFGGKR